MKKVLFVATVVRKHINVFHLPFIKWFKDNGYETYVCARNDFDDKQDCVIENCDCYVDMPFERFPIKAGNFKVYKDLKKLIEKENFDIIHCHTPVGGLLARLAARKCRKTGTKVIYTAHGFHFFKGAKLLNWLIYYPVERFASRYTDVLVTINQEDYNFAIRKMKAKEVVYVPGVGIDTAKIKNTQVDIKQKREELNISRDSFVIASVGELNDNKNHELIIRAISRLEDKEHITYVVCGKGPKKDELIKLAKEMEVNLVLPGFRNDITQILKSSDLFVFPSKREGLPVSLMEAMACGLAIVASKVRGNTDLIEDGVNGYLFESDNVEEAAASLNKAIKSDLDNMRKENLERIENYNIDSIIKQLSQIYLK